MNASLYINNQIGCKIETGEPVWQAFESLNEMSTALASGLPGISKASILGWGFAPYDEQAYVYDTAEDHLVQSPLSSLFFFSLLSIVD